MGLLIMLYKMVLTLGAGYSETFQLKATEYYFPLIMFILLSSEWVLPNEGTEHFSSKAMIIKSVQSGSVENNYRAGLFQTRVR